MALIGTAMANQRAGKHIISTRIEHASVYNPLAFLEEQGFEVTYLSVDQRGPHFPGGTGGGHPAGHHPGLHHVCEQ